MKKAPLIGISGSIEHDESKQFILRDYFTAVLAVGGIPLLMSVDMPEALLDVCLNRIDGVLLAGGTDIDPGLFGETPHPSLGQVDPLRDRFELALVQAVKKRQMPTFGICRGVQVMNVAAGGTLYQDLQTQYAADHQTPSILHSQTALGKYPSHEVQPQPGSKLAELFLCRSLAVNSFHHQAIRKPAPSLLIAAYAPDGVIEAIEDASQPFWLGVQWHPERMYQEDKSARALFAAFVNAATLYAERSRE